MTRVVEDIREKPIKQQKILFLRC